MPEIPIGGLILRCCYWWCRGLWKFFFLLTLYISSVYLLPFYCFSLLLIFCQHLLTTQEYNKLYDVRMNSLGSSFSIRKKKIAPLCNYYYYYLKTLLTFRAFIIDWDVALCHYSPSYIILSFFGWSTVIISRFGTILLFLIIWLIIGYRKGR